MLLPAVHAEDAGAAGARPEKSEQGEDQRRFARPIWSEQPYGFSRARNAETAGDPVEDLPPSSFTLRLSNSTTGVGFKLLLLSFLRSAQVPNEHYVHA